MTADIDLYHEGLLGRRAPDHWIVTDVGRQVVEARRAVSGPSSKLRDDNAQIPAVYLPSVAAGKPSPTIKSARDLVGGVEAEAVHRSVQRTLREGRRR